LHADTDDSEAQAIARRDILQRQRYIFWLKKNRWRCRERACGARRAVKELATREIFFHGALLKKIKSNQKSAIRNQNKLPSCPECEPKTRNQKLVAETTSTAGR
jgi:hypothetical protein